MTRHPDAPGPLDHLPPPVSNGGDGGGGRQALTVDPGKLFKIRSTSSPRWLKITRDALISLAALIFIVGAIVFAVALNSAGAALDELGNTTPTSAPTDPGLPTCDHDGQLGCVDPGN